MKKRKPEQVAKIDWFIAENYPEHGPDYCAEQLNLNRRYVQERAWKNKVRYTKKNRKKKSKVQQLVEENKRLSAQILKLKHENWKLRNGG